LFAIFLRAFNVFNGRGAEDRGVEGEVFLFLFFGCLLAILGTFYWVNEPYFLWVLPFLFLASVIGIKEGGGERSFEGKRVGSGSSGSGFCFVDLGVLWVFVLLQLVFIFEHYGVEFFVTGERVSYMPIEGSFGFGLGVVFGLLIFAVLFDLLTRGSFGCFLRFREVILVVGGFFFSKVSFLERRIEENFGFLGGKRGLRGFLVSLVLFFDMIFVGLVYVPYTSNWSFFKIGDASFAPNLGKSLFWPLFAIFLNFFVVFPLLFAFISSLGEEGEEKKKRVRKKGEVVIVVPFDSDGVIGGSFLRGFIFLFLFFYLVGIPLIYLFVSFG
ncbi:MAG: hypothetical protein Q6362_000400, partial [Candidatus Wukongarchaeota archaeon]|nr:hypothetical protein [Candidatus Wukongarchaeota archaeon]